MAEIQRNAQTQMQVAEISPGYIEQQASNVGLVEATITLEAASRSVLIKNTHATQKLYARFKKNSTTYNTASFTIDANGGILSVDTRVTEFKLLGEGAATTYEIVATKE